MSVELVRAKPKRAVDKHCILAGFFSCRCYRLAILKLLYMCMYVYIYIYICMYVCIQLTHILRLNK